MSEPVEPVPFAEWRAKLAEVTGHEAYGEIRISTAELVQLLGAPFASETTMRVGSVMRSLGWEGPSPMRINGRSLHGYRRLAPIAGKPEPKPPAKEVEAPHYGPPTIVQVVRDEELARRLEAVCGMSLSKLEEILRLPTDADNGNVLRAQTAAAGTVLQCQLRADETRLKHARGTDVLDRLQKLVKKYQRIIPKTPPAAPQDLGVAKQGVYQP